MEVLEISVPEFEAKTGKEDSLFQDLHVVFKVVTRFVKTNMFILSEYLSASTYAGMTSPSSFILPHVITCRTQGISLFQCLVIHDRCVA